MSGKKSGKKPSIELPKHRGKAVVIGPGQKRLAVDLSMIPPLVGDTIRIGFRGDAATVDDINEHLDRLERCAPGMAISVSDGIRSLLKRGAESFREGDTKEDDTK